MERLRRVRGQDNGNEVQGELFEGASLPEPGNNRIVYLREFNLESESDLDTYFKLLTHPDNVEHFGSPPVDASDLKRKLEHDRTHTYIAEDQLGRIVGAGGINDAAEGEHDHFLVKVVVDPNYQGKLENGEYKGEHIGKQLIVKLVEKAFATRTHDDRRREKLDAAIIEGVPGWKKMPHILGTLGFNFRSRLPGQVDVYDSKLQRIVRRPTVRWEIEREEWMRTRRRKEISQILQPPNSHIDAA